MGIFRDGIRRLFGGDTQLEPELKLELEQEKPKLREEVIGGRETWDNNEGSDSQNKEGGKLVEEVIGGEETWDQERFGGSHRIIGRNEEGRLMTTSDVITERGGAASVERMDENEVRHRKELAITRMVSDLVGRDTSFSEIHAAMSESDLSDYQFTNLDDDAGLRKVAEAVAVKLAQGEIQDLPDSAIEDIDDVKDQPAAAK